MLLVCSLVRMDLMTWPIWPLATMPWGSPKVPHIPVWSLDWGQHARHECPLERAVSRVPEGSLYRQQATCTTKRAAACSHCTPDPHGEKRLFSFLEYPVTAIEYTSLVRGRKIIQNNLTNLAVSWESLSALSFSLACSVILQLFISFAQMAHCRLILPLDSVIFNKAFAMYSRSEGCYCFLMVRLFSYDSFFSIQWMKLVALSSGWWIFFFNAKSFHFLYLLISLRKKIIGHKYSGHLFFKYLWFMNTWSYIMHTLQNILKAEFEKKSQVLGTNLLF